MLHNKSRSNGNTFCITDSVSLLEDSYHRHIQFGAFVWITIMVQLSECVYKGVHTFWLMEYYYFIQFIVRNWRWYSLRGLYIRVTWFSLNGIHIPLFSLHGIRIHLFSWYGNAAQTFERQGNFSGQGVALGCYGCCIVPRAATLTSQWWLSAVTVSWNTRGPERVPRRGNRGPSIDYLFVGSESDLLHISVE